MPALINFIDTLPLSLSGNNADKPWQIISGLTPVLQDLIVTLDEDYIVKDNIAIHKTASVEEGTVIKGPAIIGAHCFIAANAYLRGGVYLGDHVVIGPGCEVKSSIILNRCQCGAFSGHIIK